jgi:hypothetical protein
MHFATYKSAIRNSKSAIPLSATFVVNPSLNGLNESDAALRGHLGELA